MKITSLKASIHYVSVFAITVICNIFISIYIYCRSHYAWMDDCLDSFILGAYMDLMGIKDLQDEPVNHQPLFHLLSDQDKYTYIHGVAKDILDKYVKIADGT